MTMDPVLACRSLGGVASLDQLLGQGVGRTALEAALRSGRLVKVRRGVYAIASFPPDVLHALRHAARLACTSLLAVKKVWTLPDDDRLHLHLGPGSRLRAPDGCTPVLHRSVLRASGGPAATAVLDALAEIGRCLDREHLVVALDSARNLGLVRDVELPALRAALPRQLRPVVDASTPLADSGLESLVRWRLKRIGIVAVPQVRLDDGRRRDLLIGDVLIIEADGGSHDDRRQRMKDMERDAWATANGFITLRFDYDQIVKRWPEVEAAIVAVIAQGRHLRAR